MSSINVEQLLTVSAGKALALRGAYVTACHWLPDLDANSCSSGFLCVSFYFISFSPLPFFPPKSSCRLKCNSTTRPVQPDAVNRTRVRAISDACTRTPLSSCRKRTRNIPLTGCCVRERTKGRKERRRGRHMGPSPAPTATFCISHTKVLTRALQVSVRHARYVMLCRVLSGRSAFSLCGCKPLCPKLAPFVNFIQRLNMRSASGDR